MSAPSRRLLRAAAFATVLVFLGLVARFWHPVYGFTSFFQLDASNDDLKLAAFREHPVYVYRDTGGYDGLYYAQIALDPALRDPHLPAAVDNLSYRARRILPPAVAWVFGAGRPAGVIAAYSVLNVAAWLALAVLLWRILDVRDARGWLAWAGVLFSAGALCSVRLALTDLVAATLLAGTIAAAEAERKRTALACLASAALARETSLAAVAGLIKPPWISLKNAARIILALLPLAAWMAYVRWRVGPADQGWGNLTWPVVGFLEKWRDMLAAPFRIDDPWLAWTSLLALVGLTAQAAYLLVRPNLGDRWWRVGAAYVILLLCLGTAVWEGFPGAATRVLLPMTLAFNVVAYRARASVAWLLIGNLAVFSGLLALRDVPSDPRELTAGRTGPVAWVVREGAGWYGPEHSGRHTWEWGRDHGTLEIEAWPRNTPTVRLDLALRSMKTGTIVARVAGREVWRHSLDAKLTRFSFAVPLADGRAAVDFTTDAAPVREAGGADARELGFALYDPRIGVAER